MRLRGKSANTSFWPAYNGAMPFDKLRTGRMGIYREKLPHAEIVALPVDGYHVGATDPDECARIALEFLARH